jgi:hypothetical protein
VAAAGAREERSQVTTQTELLSEYNIVYRRKMRERPVQEGSALWLLGIGGLGDLVKAFSARQAAKLAGRLSSIGEKELANQIRVAAKKSLDPNVAAAAR